ncbi:MAG: hypothetical protein D6730_03545 [Bacteroidetes bacterium]|nr:MAG: hypothetical protein D6730_03545 [Bacteroidota bacterium]
MTKAFPQTSRSLIWVLAMLLGCQSPPAAPPEEDSLSHIADTAARRLLHTALEAMGGLENWRKMRQLRFYKEYTLLLENGEIESQAQQWHTYTFLPEERIEISWEQQGAPHRILYQQGVPTKYVNGQPDSTANASSLKNTVLSSVFVVSLPFKLLDQGTNLSYLGFDTLANGQAVEVLQASYNPQQHAAHSSPDTWQLYFDKEAHYLTAYLVQHADHYSYVENLRDTLVQGFRFPLERKSFRADSLRNLLYLRATYRYANYEVSF